jgi:hypothetical protein
VLASAGFMYARVAARLVRGSIIINDNIFIIISM